MLHVLPRLNAGVQGARATVSWPRWRVFIACVAAASLLLFGGFVVSFSDARALYSLAAAVHAWIEIPLLLLLLLALTSATAVATERHAITPSGIS